MKQPEIYDVVIIGAGFVGASLASALSQAQLGLRIAVIEAKPVVKTEQISENTDGRAIALSYGSYLILQKLGLWNKLSAYATSINKVHVSRRGRFGILRLSAKDVDLPALAYVVPAERLQTVLQQAMLAAPDIDVISQARLVNLDCQTAQSQITIQREGDSASELLRARLVVAADGSNSMVRQLQGIAASDASNVPEQVGLIARVQSSKPHQHVAYERFLPQGPLALLPAPKGEDWSTVIWTGEKSQMAALNEIDDAAFLAALQTAFGGRLGEFVTLGKQRYVYDLVSLEAAEQVQPGVVLLGNAAHTLHPVAAQGFNLSLRDVVDLVAVLKEAVAQERVLGDLAVLGRYVDRRCSDQRRTRQLTTGLVKLFSSGRPSVGPSLGLGLLCGLGLVGLDMLPLLRRLWMRQPLGL